MNVGIVGGSGYTGQELLRLLAMHPDVKVTIITSRSLAGQRAAEVFPSLAGAFCGFDELIFEEPDTGRLLEKADFFFTAVPHRAAMEIVPGLLDGGGRVVDLSADFRFNDADQYEAWYETHQAPELLSESVYGLPELHQDQIKTARLTGNPGCYPTSVILAAAPLIAGGVIDPGRIIADSKSGVSGAGRGLSLTTHFCEINDGFMAYKVNGHRHTPEIEQELSLLAERDVKVTFTPHLIPISRGILSTVYAPLTKNVSENDLLISARQYYADQPFVRVRDDKSLPHTLDVRGSNFCDIRYFVDERTQMAKAVAVIDNLTRGASGQAISNMNLMLGLPAQTGLNGLGLRP